VCQPEIDEEEQEQNRVNAAMAADREYKERIRTHMNVFSTKNKKEKIVMKRLPNKTWKGVNNCNRKITGWSVAKMLWSYGMAQRYSKKYIKHFPTWHAIGAKWQGQMNNLLLDIMKQTERHKDCGNYEGDLWEDKLDVVVMKIYNRVILRYHGHCKQILKSMLDDSSKLDWGKEKELFGDKRLLK